MNGIDGGAEHARASRSSAPACSGSAQGEAAGGPEALAVRPAPAGRFGTPRAMFGTRFLSCTVDRFLKIPTKASDHLNCIRLAPFSYIANIYVYPINCKEKGKLNFE